MPKKTNRKPTIRPLRRFGWIPDLPDTRDFLYAARAPRKVALPSSIDWRSVCPPIVDQGQLGSCTANALAGGLGFLENKDKIPFTALSRLFIYYNERVAEDTVGTDSGAMLRDGIKTLAAYGACAESEWPYVIGRFKTKPSAACYRDGAKHQITTYQRLSTLDDMRDCLSSGFPFVFGFTVYESMESAEVAQTGVVPMPGPSERPLGGHAVLAVGYNDETKRFIFRNSWGTSWAMSGYATIPYDYLTNRNLSDDFWTIRRAGGL